MEQGAMGPPSDVETELQAFAEAIAERGWHVRLTRYTASRGVCVRIERRIEGVHVSLDAIEICRSTFARTIESARKRIFPRRLV
jgi:hypothetical protein